jgi:hypothetical protein
MRKVDRGTLRHMMVKGKGNAREDRRSGQATAPAPVISAQTNIFPWSAPKIPCSGRFDSLFCAARKLLQNRLGAWGFRSVGAPARALSR